jgi:hypothetical protein
MESAVRESLLFRERVELSEAIEKGEKRRWHMRLTTSSNDVSSLPINDRIP